MTSEEEKDLRAYCVYLLTEYGFQFSPDNPVIPALYIIYRHTKSNTEANKVLTSQIQEALSKIKPEEFHFHYPGEAWKFQMAGLLKLIVCFGLILTILFVGLWQWSRANDVEQAKTIIQSSGNMGVLLHRIKVSDRGTYYIDFTAPNGDSVQHFFEYKKLDKKTIRVYLGRESDHSSK